MAFGEAGGGSRLVAEVAGDWYTAGGDGLGLMVGEGPADPVELGKDVDTGVCRVGVAPDCGWANCRRASCAGFGGTACPLTGG